MAMIRKHFIPNPDFQPSKVRHASSAAEGMCKWVRALEKYDKVARVVAPKKRAVEAAQKVLDAKLVELQKKQVRRRLPDCPTPALPLEAVHKR